MRLPLFTASLGFVAGTVVQMLQAHLWPPPAYLLLATFGLFGLVASVAASRLAIYSVAGQKAWLGGCVLVSVALLAWAWAGGRAHLRAHDRIDADLEGRTLQVTGVVAGLPQSNELGVRFVFATESARDEAGQPVRVPDRVLLGWWGGTRSLRLRTDDTARDGGSWAAGDSDTWDLQALAPDVRVGDRWTWTVRLKAPHGARNPHGFDHELWLWEHGIGATGSVRAGPRDPPPQRLESTGAHPVDRWRQRTRDAIETHLAGTDDSRRATAGVVAALVMGDQASIERVDWDVFRATGIAHLMSISGLHITLFAWLAQALIGSLWRRSAWLCLRMPAPHAAAWGGLLLATGYALFAGMGVPAQRTVLMLALALGVRGLGLVWPAAVTWVVACAVVLAFDPWAVTQAGFWLSFVAVGILFAGPPAAPLAGRAWLSSAARALLREQWLVSAALAPLSCVLFGQVSLVGLLANLVAIPWVTLVVTPLALTGMLLPLAWDGAAWAVDVMLVILRPLSQLPGAVWDTAAAPAGVLALGLLGGGLLALDWPRPWRLAGIALMLPLLTWRVDRPAPGEFDVLAADIGQGNAVVVRTRSHALLYDTGPRYSRDSDAGHRVLVPLLRALGTRLDRVVVSHRDSDHSGGAAAVLAMQPQALVLASFGLEPAAAAPQAPMRCEAGQSWEWDGVRFSILHPPAEAYNASPAWRANALSCVLRIESPKGVVALLVGDIEAAQEGALVAGQAPLRAHWLLVPHHGSKTSSTEAFAQAVRPLHAVVQAGYRNRFGHPVAAVVDRYQAVDARVTELAACGAATWSSDQPDTMACERERRHRYWQHEVPPRAPDSPRR